MASNSTTLQSRRHFLAAGGLGLGQLALHGWLGAPGAGGVRPPHHRAKAKRVIQLFMGGAPSQLELFDFKPALAKLHDERVPASVVKDQRYAFIRPDAKLLAPQFAFRRAGACGAELSEVLPHLAAVVDDLAIVKSMTTDQFNHAPAQILAQTGGPQPGRPSLGAWLSYGLGSETQDLPAFVVLTSGGGSSGGSALWHNGFLPGEHQGVRLRSQGQPILNLELPPGVDAQLQRDSLDLLSALNSAHYDAVGDPAIKTRLAAYEMAFRMQRAAPELIDLSREPKSVLDLYGVDPGKPSFARNVLLARRLVERGVRSVLVFHEAWDHHAEVKNGVQEQARVTDQASAALVLDLKQRGLLDDTLVVWGGEFGRTPMVEHHVALQRLQGRDHHPQAFSMWLAGGGIRGGLTLGQTDELGFHVVEDPVHIHDLHATMLHLLGFDHENLTFRAQGRDFRLTDVHGRVVRKLLA